MRRKIAIRGGVAFLALAIGFSLGYVVHWGTTRDRESDAIQRVVAKSWGDGKYGKAFYGAEVYVLPATGGVVVREQGLSYEFLDDSERYDAPGITARRWLWDDYKLFVRFDKDGVSSVTT